jgi:hypothetical protein
VPPPAHFLQPERDLWCAITREHRFLTTTSLTLLAVAMEARGVMRHTWDRIKKEGPKNQLLDAHSRSIKAYVNAMRQLRVLPR